MTTQIRELNLPPETLSELQVQYKATRDRRLAQRILCLILKAKSYTHEEVSSILMVSPNTITAWLQCYVTQGLPALCEMDVGGSNPNLNETQIEELRAELDQRVFNNAAQVAVWVSHRFGITYSERGMQALLKRLDCTIQRARIVPEARRRRINQQVPED